MKRSSVLLLFVLLSWCLSAQDVKYPEPDFATVPMWYDATSQTLKGFERTPPNKGARASGMVSAESLIFFANETSTVQFPSGKIPAIIVKMNSPTEDPAGVVELAQLQVNKHKHQREYIVGKAGMTSNKTTVSTITLDFKKLGNGVYQIVPSQTLEAGEYCFAVGKKAFLFSIL